MLLVAVGNVIENSMKAEMEIVIIEDNDEDAISLLKFLKANVTNSIRLIQDGAHAAEFLLSEADSVPKLILLDLILPSVDGLELYRLIRSQPEKRKLFVVFLVSSSQAKDYIESIGLCPDGYLKKPTNEKIPLRFV